MLVPRSSAYGRSTVLRVAALALATSLCSAALSACYWLRYDDLAATHAELMERTALDAVAGLDEGLRPYDIERMRYPLKRARDFAEIARRRFGRSPWIDRFDELVEVYGDLVVELDRLRVGRAAAMDAGAMERAGGLARKVSRRAERLRRSLADG